MHVELHVIWDEALPKSKVYLKPSSAEENMADVVELQ